MSYAVHHERVPASGFTYGAVVRLTHKDAPDGVKHWPTHRGCLICHAVLARDDVLRLFEVRTGGVARLVQVRMHRLFGEVTGVEAVRTIASQYDGRERVLVSFRDAKLALMEWKDEYGDLCTVSIHTFERAPQLEAGLPAAFTPVLRVDPACRCSALLLPHDAIAVLPLYQDASELGLDDTAGGAPATEAAASQVPYAPSFVLAFTSDVDAGIRNVRDFVFLDGFQKPTLAVLYSPELTWTGSLSRTRQTMRVCLVTLDVSVARYPATVTSAPLPYDVLYLVACPAALGGVLLVTPSALLHLDQTARLVGVGVNAWLSRTSDLSLPMYTEAGDLDLRDSQLAFTGSADAQLFLRDGRVFNVHCALEGRSVTSITLAPVHATRTGGASFVHALPDAHVLCGSVQDDTYLYSMEVEATAGTAAAGGPAAPIDADELDLYGESAVPAGLAKDAACPARLHALDAVPTLAPLNGVAVGAVRDARGHVAPRTVAAMQQHLAVLAPQLSARVVQTIAPARDVWYAAPLLFAAWGDECIVYAVEEEQRFIAQLSGRTLACGATVGGVVRVTPGGAACFINGAEQPVCGARNDGGGEVCAAAVGGAYVALAYQDGRCDVWRCGGHAWSPAATVLDCQLVDVYEDEGVLDAPTTWLVAVSPSGCVSLHSLPDGTCRWRSDELPQLPSRISDVGSRARRTDADALDGAEDLSIHTLRLCTLGDVPALVIQYSNGQLAVFEALVTSELSFVRVDAYMLSAPCHALVPFVGLGGRRCVAAPGEHAVVLVHDVKSALQCLELEEPTDAWAAGPNDTSVAVQRDQAVVLAFDALSLDALVPYERWSTGRTYTHVACHEETASVVAASVQPTAFVLYNDEERPVQDPAADPLPTMGVRGAVELFARTGEDPVHGYELEPCETVTSLLVAGLDALDRLSARRPFVAAGTMTSYGEDRTVRGHMYVFDVIEAVPGQGAAPGDALQLRCICREEMRAPVTALSDLNGFLVAAVGQKLLVRSLEFTEWLVTVSFLDVAFYTTSIQRVKNFLLLTDLHRSAAFVAFQTNPTRLVLLGRDYNTAALLTGGMLVDRSRLALVTADMGGCLRLLEYNPSNPTSLGGQRLLVKTEYHVSSEVAQMLQLRGPRVARGECYSSELLLAKRNGAVDVLVPVDEKIFPALQLFQSQLVRAVRHAAGLNPRAYRAVHNVRLSRPLAKGILDGLLLHTAENMSRPKLERLVQDLSPRTGGVVPDDLLRCLVHLAPQW